MEEVAGCFFNERLLFCSDRFVVDVSGGAGQVFEAFVVEPAALGEKFKRNEQRIAGEGGERGVRGIAVAGGAKGKNLPEALF